MPDQPEQPTEEQISDKHFAVTLEPEDIIKQVQENNKPKLPSHVDDLPYCPVRVGRIIRDTPEDGTPIISAKPACGYEETNIDVCLNCLVPHGTNENKILAQKKLVKHSQSIRELNQRLVKAEADIEELKRIIIGQAKS